MLSIMITIITLCVLAAQRKKKTCAFLDLSFSDSQISLRLQILNEAETINTRLSGYRADFGKNVCFFLIARVLL